MLAGRCTPCLHAPLSSAQADSARYAEWLGGLQACIPGLGTYRNTDIKSRAV